jgi:hypothetical protein
MCHAAQEVSSSFLPGSVAFERQLSSHLLHLDIVLLLDFAQTRFGTRFGLRYGL